MILIGFEMTAKNKYKKKHATEACFTDTLQTNIWFNFQKTETLMNKNVNREGDRD